ncbi:MAG: amidohydrolase [Chloroflexota bacterium]
MSTYSSNEVALINGVVVTLEPQLPRAEAILIRDGRIAHVGKTLDVLHLKGPNCEAVDLEGRVVLPGLVESHMHPAMLGASLLEVNCRHPEVRSIEDILSRVRERVKERPLGSWIVGGGYDDTKLEEKRHLTRWELDTVAPDHPVFIKRTCLHMGVANSKALELAGVTSDTQDPEGGVIVRDAATGEPTGLLQEKAQDLLGIPPYSENEMEQGLELALDRLASYGITTVHEMSGTALGLRAYQNLLAEGRLTARIRLWLMALPALGFEGLLPHVLGLGLKSGYGNDMLRFMGMKFVLDGAISGRTAAVEDGYVGEPHNKGVLYFDQGQLDKHVAECLKNGLRVAIHGIGERALEQAIGSIERATEVVPLDVIRRMRNRIEHYSLPTLDQIKRTKEVGLLAGVSVAFIHSLGDSQRAALGPERMKRLYPCRTLADLGVPFAANSDCPVCDSNPFRGIHSAVTRTTESGQILDNVQNLTVEEAIAAYTTQAAYFALEEDLYGTLRPGKLGDLVVLPGNPYEMSPEAIKDLKVEMTFVGGHKVYPK